jgi:hypothetical protein
MNALLPAADFSQGESLPDTTLNPSDLAAYAAVASMLFNLDEAVTKQ